MEIGIRFIQSISQSSVRLQVMIFWNRETGMGHFEVFAWIICGLSVLIYSGKSEYTKHISRNKKKNSPITRQKVVMIAKFIVLGN